MPTVTVYNRGGNNVEAAGRVWPPRRPTTADLTDDQLATVRAHRRLEIRDDQERPLSKRKVAELRELCEQRGLDATGTKAELVARLTDGDSDGDG
ncbi:MAG: SAP domain-containing protein [Actinomycetota bacterium]